MASPDDTEQQFYEALQQADIERLMAVWADEDDIACVHPGGPRIVGAGAIRASFDAMFANGAIQADAARVRRIHSADAAVHHVLERVRMPSEQGEQVAWVLATNVYLQTPQGWRLVLHHASPGSPRELQEIVDTPPMLH
jgi:ketosteroid isomerase-like protein